METPIHAASEVDKGETVPKIVAAVAGIALLAIAAGVVIYSGIWSPPPTTVSATHK
jgi:Na+(H+)/acetate symporter ActP